MKFKKNKVCPKGPLAAGVIVGGVDGRVVRKAVKDGADILEVRLDTFKDLSPVAVAGAFEKIRSLTELPLLATVRSSCEGGVRKISEKKRAEIFSIAMPFADLIDIELSSRNILKNVVDLANKHGKCTIVSCHDFKRTPEDKILKDIVKKGRAAGADFVKIAARAKSGDDLRRLAGLLASFDGLIVIAMGGPGAASRVFFPFLGSYITYGSLTETTAPGQLPLKQIKKEFSLYGLTGLTRE